MSTKTDRSIDRIGRSIILSKVLKPIVEVILVFIWIAYLAFVLTHLTYDGNLTFDLYLARVGGPTASHTTTYLLFLSIFPLAYLMLKSIIPAFLIEALAFEIHEGLWQVPYYLAWRSVIDWNIWLAQNAADTLTAAIVIITLVLVYHLPARFFAIVAVAWGCFLSAWLALGFPVSVLSKLPNFRVSPSIYNTTLWVNQIEFVGWVFFASVLLISLRYSVRLMRSRSPPSPGGEPTSDGAQEADSTSGAAALRDYHQRPRADRAGDDVRRVLPGLE